MITRLCTTIDAPYYAPHVAAAWHCLLDYCKQEIFSRSLAGISSKISPPPPAQPKKSTLPNRKAPTKWKDLPSFETKERKAAELEQLPINTSSKPKPPQQLTSKQILEKILRKNIELETERADAFDRLAQQVDKKL